MDRSRCPREGPAPGSTCQGVVEESSPESLEVLDPCAQRAFCKPEEGTDVRLRSLPANEQSQPAEIEIEGVQESIELLFTLKDGGFRLGDIQCPDFVQGKNG